MSGAQPEVLIVGAGPAGLTAAVVLAAHGVPARVVDPESGPTDQSRALVVQARTLELWDKLGLAEPAVAAGKPMTAVVAYSNGGVLNDGHTLLPLGELGTGQTPYPFLLVFEQSKTERLLLDKLAELGGTVDWGVTAEAVTNVDGGVEVTLRGGGDGVQRVRPRWVIGADGASSTVRHALGLGFEGGSYEQAFFLADVAVTWAQPPDALYVALTDTGTFLFVPMPTDAGQTPRYRVLGSVTAEVATKERLDLSDVQIAIDNHAGVRATVSDAKWVSLYRLHHRMAERFRVGNVFLAGDAAHIHSPIGGQGMNTGIQDAYNLAWKLALVLRAGATPALLDTYNEERLANARHLVGSTDRFFDVMAGDSWSMVQLRRHVLPGFVKLMTSFNPVREIMFPAMAETAISYREQSLSQGPRRGHFTVTPGDRMPYFLDNGTNVFEKFHAAKFHLVHFTDGQAAPQDSATQLDPHLDPWIDTTVVPLYPRVTELFGTDKPFTVLLRPDNHIAAIWPGHDTTPAQQWLTTHITTNHAP